MSRLFGIVTVCAMLAAGCVDQAGPGSSDPDDADEGPEMDTGFIEEDANTGGTGGGGGCEPVSESCNGEDDDCDGTADEDFSIGEGCTLEMGGCTSDGTWACSPDGLSAVCDAPEPTPSDEVCDDTDNDCDGEVDEAFDFNVDPANCGGCGQACDLANANPLCEAAACGIASCLDGFGDPDGDPANGCECVIANGGDEACNGLDDDCDGTIDEGLGIGEACSAGIGACAADGETVCGPDGDVVCGAQPGQPADEACNGLDDDCDGEADEAFDQDGDGFSSCDCPDCGPVDCRDDDENISPGAAEICEDGIDQNCDGEDISCDVAAGRLNTIAVAAPNGAGCRDINGVGGVDNVFGNPVLTAVVNPELQSAVTEQQLNLIAITPGLAAPGRDGIFDFGVVFANDEGNDYRVSPAALDEDGQPIMLFPAAEVAGGALTAGPGTFLLNLNQGGVNADLRISDTIVTGALSVNDQGVTIADGWVTGYVTDEDFQAALVIVPEDLRALVPLLIQPDIDSDEDGRPDAYSACVQFTAEPVNLLGFPPDP